MNCTKQISIPLVILLLLLSITCNASIVGWLLGRDNSPFDILNSDDNFDKLLAKTEKVESSPKSGRQGSTEENAIQATSDIPFELSVADEKFIADAQKYTDLSLSELDLCQHRLILQLKQDCNDLTEEELSKLGVNLLNCQSRLEGRRVYPCTAYMALKDCTKDMDPDTWNAYHILSNRARSVCYGARQQQFRALTQMTVNKLMASSHEQLGFIRELKAEQEELGSLAANTLGSLTKGQEKLLEQQEYLKSTQQMASQAISSTMRELSRERAAAFASQRQLSALSDSLKETLDQAAQMALQQENERKVAQQHLLESLTKIEGHVGDFWSQLEDSVEKLLVQQEHAASMQSETVETLQKLNQTFQFLLSVSESSRDQLNWIQGLVANTEKRMGKLSTWVQHVCYFLLGMLLLSFVQAPSYTRWIFLVLVPINLAMDLQQGVAMELPALVGLLFLFSLVFRTVLFLKRRCSKPVKSPLKGIQYRCSSTPQKKHLSNLDDTVPDVMLSGTLLNDTLGNTASSTPLPTWDSLIQRQNEVLDQHHATVRSLMQDSCVDEASLLNASTSSTLRRSARNTSYREGSPAPLLTPGKLLNSSRLGSPSRPSSPRRHCGGKRLDGSSCRNSATRDSPFCWQHK